MKHKGQPIKNKGEASFLQRLLDQETFQDFKFIIQERSSYSRRKRSLKNILGEIFQDSKKCVMKIGIFLEDMRFLEYLVFLESLRTIS